MQRQPFITGDFYHVFNRGVDKRKIFLSERDRERFVMALYLFNEKRSRDYDLTKIKLRGLTSYRKDSDALVDIVQWCLMPNHFHLLLRQRVDDGVSSFMQKVGTSYTMFFNVKHARSGRLFQSSYRSKHVALDEYFSHLASYIPLNAVELFYPKWKEEGIQGGGLIKAKELLSDYPWSSFRDYFAEGFIKNFVSKDVFFAVFGGSLVQYEKLIDLLLLRGLPHDSKEDLLHYEV